MTRTQHFGAAAVLVSLLAVLYVDPSATWVHEDTNELQGATSVSSAPRILTPRGLTRWTWWMQAQRAEPYLAFRAVNLGFFAVSLGLFWWLARRVGLTASSAWIAVAVFACHAMTVESVAYATGRSELLAAIGVLAACVLAAGSWWHAPVALGILALLAFGMLGKESAVVGLALVPLTMWASAPAGRPRWASCWLPLAVSLVGVIGGLWWFGGLERVVNVDLHANEVRWQDWVLSQGAAAHLLMSQAIWPIGLTVDADIDAVVPAAKAFGLGVVVAVGLAAWACRERAPLIAFGLAWCVASLIPRFVVQTPRSYLNAHQFFVPFMGLVLAAAAVWDSQVERA